MTTKNNIDGFTFASSMSFLVVLLLLPFFPISKIYSIVLRSPQIRN